MEDRLEVLPLGGADAGEFLAVDGRVGDKFRAVGGDPVPGGGAGVDSGDAERF